MCVCVFNGKTQDIENFTASGNNQTRMESRQKIKITIISKFHSEMKTIKKRIRGIRSMEQPAINFKFNAERTRVGH